jgi:hypothetical protein
MLKALVLAIAVTVSIAGVIITENAAWSQAYPEMVSGVIKAIDGQNITIETSPGKLLVVNIAVAKSEDHIGSPIVVGRRVVVHGWYRGDKFFAGAVHKGQ